jgi:hypothetical protein
VDPIERLSPSSGALPSRSAPPVERLQRVSRERDRPPRERPSAPPREPAPEQSEDGEDDEGRPRIDVRV